MRTTANDVQTDPYRSHLYITQNRAVSAQINFVWWVRRAGGVNVDEDPARELAITYVGDSLAGVRIYDWPSLDTLCIFEMHERDYRWRNRLDKWDLWFELGPVVRASTGEISLIVKSHTGYCRMPRGLIAIDPRTGTERWHYWIGGAVHFVEELPSADGKVRDLICGTISSCNGAEFNGTRDDNSYLFRLSTDGKEIWRREFNGPFGCVWPRVFTGSQGAPRIAALHSSCEGCDAPPSLMLIDPESGESLEQISLPEADVAPYLHVWQAGSGSPAYLFVTTLNHGVLVFDSELQQISTLHELRTVIAIEDLTGNGIPEAIAVDAAGFTRLLEADGRLLAKREFNATGGFLLTAEHADSRNLLLHNPYQTSRLALEPDGLYASKILWRLLALFLLPLVLFFVSRYVLRLRRAVLMARAERERTLAWAAMASKLAHDIRTPMAIWKVSGDNLELEMEALYGEIPNRLRTYFDTFRREAGRTENVARSLLKFARVEPPVLESLNLVDLVSTIVERHPHSPDVRISVETEDGLSVIQADHQQVTNLIDNLISNSLKAIKGPGEVTVRISRARKLHKGSSQSEGILLEIADTGRGISAEDLPRVFEPYFSHSEGGTGLGLAIVKRIVEDHGAEITIESESGRGTLVRVRFPIQTGDIDE